MKIKSLLNKYMASTFFISLIIIFILTVIIQSVKYNRCSKEYKATVTDLGEYPWRNTQGMKTTFYKPEYTVEINDETVTFKEEKGRHYLPWGVEKVDTITILRINPLNKKEWINKNLIKRDIIVTYIYIGICSIIGLITILMEKEINFRRNV